MFNYETCLVVYLYFYVFESFPCVLLKIHLTIVLWQLAGDTTGTYGWVSVRSLVYLFNQLLAFNCACHHAPIVGNSLAHNTPSMTERTVAPAPSP